MFKKFLVSVSLLMASVGATAEDAVDGPFLKGDIVYGDSSAPIEIIEYGSMTCHHCGNFSRDIFPQVKKDLIDTGKVRFVFRNFVRDRIDLAVATISRCTSEVDTTKNLIDTFFEKQEDWMHADNPYDVIASIANEGGITRPEMARCISDQDAAKHLVDMQQNAIKTYQVSRIPYILLNGKPVENYSFEAIMAAVDAVEGAAE